MKHGASNFAKPKNTVGVLKKLFEYLKHEHILLYVVVLCTILNTIAVITPSFMISPLIDKLISLKSMSMFSVAIETLVKYLVFFGVVCIVGVLSNYLLSYITLLVSQRTVTRLRKDLFNRLKLLPIRYFDSRPHGEIMSRFTNDMDNISEALSNSIVQLFSSTMTLLGTFVFMLIMSPILTLVSLFMFPLMFKASSTILKKSGNSFRNQQRDLGKLNGFIEEIIEGQKVVKAFCCEDDIKKQFDTFNAEYQSSARKAQTYSGIIMPVMINIGNLNYALNTAIGAVLILINALTIGKLTSFLQLVRQFGRPLAELSAQIATVQSALAGAERIFEVINEDTEQYDTNKNADANENSYGVTFENVQFSYVPDKLVLNNVSFYAKPGQKIALVGSTGAGKTTIANLITRFYDIEHGTIKINDINIKDINLNELRSKLGIVLQDTFLFEGTVMENIRYGNFEATDEECIAAAKLSNAHEFIKRLPRGYNTLLTSNGKNLSQGQRQLLSIARVAVSQPKILILDEATSSVDTRTERLIESGMDKLMHDRTTFVIAHRLSTIRNANAILVIENGEIIERGDHDDLINQRGRYYELCTGQYELK